MNYFKLFEQPEQLSTDREQVRKAYYALSRQYHPDRLMQLDADAQAEGLEHAALLNRAYKTLLDRDATLAYVLKRAGVLEDEEQYALPPDFLMEMMELNEQIDEGGDAEAARRALDGALREWETGVRGAAEEFDAGKRDDALLQKLKDYYFRKKYLLRVQGRMDNFGGVQEGL